MALFLKHEPCPECGSKDNLGRYDDGSAYCFGCGYIEGINGFQRLRQLRVKRDAAELRVALPPDSADNLPLIPAWQWLSQYGITSDEVTRHQFKWSHDRQFLVMPVYDPYDNLLMWQARNFSNYGPKYYTSGKPEKVDHILGNFGQHTIVVVEDLLSAIKVSRVQNAIPLWGSQLSESRLCRLANSFGNMVLWLDKDKLRESVKFKQKADPAFQAVHIISTELDPKEYSNTDIRKYLTNLTN